MDDLIAEDPPLAPTLASEPVHRPTRRTRKELCQARTSRGKRCRHLAKNEADDGQKLCALHTPGYTRPIPNYPECPTCFDACRPRESTSLVCGHTFHTSCIRTWFSQIHMIPNANKCPMCRQVVDEAFIQQILPNYAHLIQTRQEELEGIRIWLPSIQRFIRLSREVNNQQSLRELIIALDQQLLVLHGFDILSTDPLFGLRLHTQFQDNEAQMLQLNFPDTPADLLGDSQ